MVGIWRSESTGIRERRGAIRLATKRHKGSELLDWLSRAYGRNDDTVRASDFLCLLVANLQDPALRAQHNR